MPFERCIDFGIGQRSGFVVMEQHDPTLPTVEDRADKHAQVLPRVGNLHPVEYSDDLPTIKLINRDEFDLAMTLYKKTREWRGEDEWRIMSIIQAQPPFPLNFTANSKIRLENGVSAVIFGTNTPEILADKIRSKVSSKRPSMTFKRVVRDQLTYDRKLVTI